MAQYQENAAQRLYRRTKRNVRNAAQEVKNHVERNKETYMLTVGLTVAIGLVRKVIR